MDNTVRLNMQQRLNNLKHKFLELYQFQDVTENELKTFKNNINSSFYKIQRVLKNSGSIIEDYDRVTMQLIANLGGICQDGVNKDTNYLILGNTDYNPQLRGKKSSKLLKAEEMKVKGYDIEIISENVFYDILKEYSK